MRRIGKIVLVWTMVVLLSIDSASACRWLCGRCSYTPCCEPRPCCPQTSCYQAPTCSQPSSCCPAPTCCQPQTYSQPAVNCPACSGATSSSPPVGVPSAPATMAPPAPVGPGITDRPPPAPNPDPDVPNITPPVETPMVNPTGGFGPPKVGPFQPNEKPIEPPQVIPAEKGPETAKPIIESPFEVPSEPKIPAKEDPKETPKPFVEDVFGAPAKEPVPPVEKPVTPPVPEKPTTPPVDDPFGLNMPEKSTTPPAVEKPATPAVDDPFGAPAPEKPATPPPAKPTTPADDDPFKSSQAPAEAVQFDVAREWSDASGGFRVTARLTQILDGKVRLLKESGKFTTVSIARLSSADQQFVQQAIAQLDRGEKLAQGN